MKTFLTIWLLLVVALASFVLILLSMQHVHWTFTKTLGISAVIIPAVGIPFTLRFHEKIIFLLSPLWLGTLLVYAWLREKI